MEELTSEEIAIIKMALTSYGIEDHIYVEIVDKLEQL